jgi:xanthine/CO dehydrogenase XdhC/CoxF family maturation factor
LVRPATLNSMIEHHHRHRPQIIIPIYRGFRGNPILLGRSVFPELMNLQGDIGCRAIFGSHTENIYKLPVEDEGILLDLDTLADLSAMGALLEPQHGRSFLSSNAEMEERPMPTTHSDEPQPELIIVGRDALAEALVRFANILGLAITLVDPFLTLAEMPDAHRILHRLDLSMLPENDNRYVVVASRGQFDEEALEQAVACGARYVALVANKGRREELLQTLRKKGFGEEALQRLRSPAGLEIGAETPQEIALSILVQIVAEMKGALRC